MTYVIIDYKGKCPECDGSDFELIDEIGEDIQWIKCRYCESPWLTNKGKIEEE